MTTHSEREAGTFKKENRYFVIKRSDLNGAQRRLAMGMPCRKAVVVEADWPEYEPVWKMIQGRTEAKAKP